jgi:hypothetical protein
LKSLRILTKFYNVIVENFKCLYKISKFDFEQKNKFEEKRFDLYRNQTLLKQQIQIHVNEMEKLKFKSQKFQQKLKSYENKEKMLQKRINNSHANVDTFMIKQSDKYDKEVFERTKSILELKNSLDKRNSTLNQKQKRLKRQIQIYVDAYEKVKLKNKIFQEKSKIYETKEKMLETQIKHSQVNVDTFMQKQIKKYDNKVFESIRSIEKLQKQMNVIPMF